MFKCLGSPLVFTATASNSSKDGGTNKSRQLIERIDVMARRAKVQFESVPKRKSKYLFKGPFRQCKQRCLFEFKTNIKANI